MKKIAAPSENRSNVNKENLLFFNQIFDKKRLKALISWVFKQSGEAEALRVIDLLKETGFKQATKAGISIGLHDLVTPIQKAVLISESQLGIATTDRDFSGAKITATERSQRIIDTWHRASESLSKQVVDYFAIYDRFNPVYIMALSGARGNFSQVRQLIGMRGLMADQQGKIVNFPIQSNLREGLTLTEYFISCSGARKGLVDTALRTADTGYLTRRLVDVSHHVVVKKLRCNTNRSLAFRSLQSYNKVLLPLKERLVGRVLSEDIFISEEKLARKNKTWPFVQIEDLDDTYGKGPSGFATENRLLQSSDEYKTTIAKQDQEISLKLALKIAKVREKVYLRSPLTCGFTHSVCQLCYGWSISQGSLVSLGDAVGVIAAQSIGEPGTQLTMRTFHTGGVFSGDLLQEIRAPHAGKIAFSKAFGGLLIRTAHGHLAFLSKSEGSLYISNDEPRSKKLNTRKTVISIPAFSLLFIRHGERVTNNQLLAEFSIRTKEGAQPIKTQQTIFAELSGIIVEDCSGRVYTKRIKESALLLDSQSSSSQSLCLNFQESNSFNSRVGRDQQGPEGEVTPSNFKQIEDLLCFTSGDAKSDKSSYKSSICTCSVARLAGDTAPPPVSQKVIQSKSSICTYTKGPRSKISHNEVTALLPKVDSQEGKSILAGFKPSVRASEAEKAKLFKTKSIKSSICKAQTNINFDIENDLFSYVEPVQSGRLGFLKILSTRIGATLDYSYPIKSIDSHFVKKNKIHHLKKDRYYTNLELVNLKSLSLRFLQIENKYLAQKGIIANPLTEYLKPYFNFHALLTSTSTNRRFASPPVKRSKVRQIFDLKRSEVRRFASPPVKRSKVRQIFDLKRSEVRRFVCKVSRRGASPFTFYIFEKERDQNLENSLLKNKIPRFCFSKVESKYLHPNSIEENRFFLQTIAEYGDIVDETYKKKNERFFSNF